MNRLSELTFDVVDDLVWASSMGRLIEPRPGQHFSPRRIGPLVELALQAGECRGRALVNSEWINQQIQSDFRAALMAPARSWYDAGRFRGLLRAMRRPYAESYDLVRTGFLIAARQAAEAAGFPVATAQSLAAAMREMESNIHEHSEAVESGIMVFQAWRSEFEFVIADTGVGVLATLKEAPEYTNLRDHGHALRTALQDGASRFGRAASRGCGFNELFVGLASLNADLRFRSGDHALTISGPHASLKTARLSQKPIYQGFLASVRCALPSVSRATH